MTRALGATILLLGTILLSWLAYVIAAANAAPLPCSGSGQGPIDCPRYFHAAKPARSHHPTLGGSGMTGGRGGYLGRCGARPHDDAGHCK